MTGTDAIFHAPAGTLGGVKPIGATRSSGSAGVVASIGADDQEPLGTATLDGRAPFYAAVTPSAASSLADGDGQRDAPPSVVVHSAGNDAFPRTGEETVSAEVPWTVDHPGRAGSPDSESIPHVGSLNPDTTSQNVRTGWFRGSGLQDGTCDDPGTEPPLTTTTADEVGVVLVYFGRGTVARLTALAFGLQTGGSEHEVRLVSVWSGVPGSDADSHPAPGEA